MLTLLICLSVAHIGDSSARLLVDADSAAPIGSLVSESSLKSRIALIQKEIGRIKVRWGPASVITTSLGFSAAAALLLGIPFLVMGLNAGSFLSAFVSIGIMFTTIGAIGLIAGFIGVVSGIIAERNSRDARQTLIDERDDLQQMLKDRFETMAPVVLRDISVTPLFVVARW